MFASKHTLLMVGLLAMGCSSRTPPQSVPTAQSPNTAREAASTPDALFPEVRTVWEGVFTVEQAQRGEEAYRACRLCHRPDLTGSEIIPALVGEYFLERWGRTTAGDLFERLRTSMPPNASQRLTPEGYADVIGYIFSMNGFPAGDVELASEFDALKSINIKPER